MKTKSNTSALVLLFISLTLGLAFDTLFVAVRQRAAETLIMAPLAWAQLAISTGFVLTVIFLLWFVLVRSVPGRTVFVVYLVVGLILSAYIPLYLSGIDLTLGLVTPELRAFMMDRGMNSFLILHAITLFGIGVSGLVRAQPAG